MAVIFISYRKSDSIWPTSVLHPRLRLRFGNQSVFRDREDIAPGCDWKAVIKENLESCNVFIPVIGRDWLNAKDDSGASRLGANEDTHTEEIEFALNKPSIKILPVYLDDTDELNRSDLPAAISELASIQGIRIDAKYEPEVGFLKLESAIEKELVSRGVIESPLRERTREQGFKRVILFAIAVIVLIPLILVLAPANYSSFTQEEGERAKGKSKSELKQETLNEIKEAYSTRGISPSKVSLLEETAVASLGKPDYSNFDIHFDKRVWSFIHYKPSKIIEGGFKSATVTFRSVVVAKTSEVDELRFEQRTQGSDITFSSVHTAGKARVESTRGYTYSGKYKTKVKHLCVDVSGFAVGQEFFISYTATNWNADDRDDRWFGAITYPGCKQLKILALSTTPAFFSNLNVSRSDDFKSPNMPTSEGALTLNEDGSAFAWTVENPEAKKIYMFHY